jgi:hypothetical protein
MQQLIGDAGIVGRILLSDAMCVECLMATTDMDLDRVLNALEAIDARLTIKRAWGRCRLCRRGDRAILTLA